MILDPKIDNVHDLLRALTAQRTAWYSLLARIDSPTQDPAMQAVQERLRAHAVAEANNLSGLIYVLGNIARKELS